MILFQKKCGACEAKSDIIRFLQGEVAAIRKERDSERAEYKRAMDVLLMKNDLPPLGQGVGLESKQPSVQDMMKDAASIFEEVKE